jgi:hypothetical protein
VRFVRAGAQSLPARIEIDVEIFALRLCALSELPCSSAPKPVLRYKLMSSPQWADLPSGEAENNNSRSDSRSASESHRSRYAIVIDDDPSK